MTSLVPVTSSNSSTGVNSSLVFSWDFSQGTSNWLGGFADYPVGEEDFYELDFGLRSLPSNLGGETSLFITGNNHSDDLFMYFRNVVTGLAPETTYSVKFNVELASNAPDGSIGIGGSPANSVYLKAGVTQFEPLATIAPDSNFWLLNADKGNQSQSGQDALLLGDIAKPDDGTFDYALITRDNSAQPFTFRTDNSGSAWLFFGTDSGYEGTTALYYTNFRAEFTPVTTPVPESSSVLFLMMAGSWMLLRSCQVKWHQSWVKLGFLSASKNRS